jgi:hypothetical protein
MVAQLLRKCLSRYATTSARRCSPHKATCCPATQDQFQYYPPTWACILCFSIILLPVPVSCVSMLSSYLCLYPVFQCYPPTCACILCFSVILLLGPVSCVLVLSSYLVLYLVFQCYPPTWACILCFSVILLPGPVSCFSVILLPGPVACVSVLSSYLCLYLVLKFSDHSLYASLISCMRAAWPVSLILVTIFVQA